MIFHHTVWKHFRSTHTHTHTFLSEQKPSRREINAVYMYWIWSLDFRKGWAEGTRGVAKVFNEFSALSSTHHVLTKQYDCEHLLGSKKNCPRHITEEWRQTMSVVYFEMRGTLKRKRAVISTYSRSTFSYYRPGGEENGDMGHRLSTVIKNKK